MMKRRVHLKTTATGWLLLLGVVLFPACSGGDDSAPSSQWLCSHEPGTSYCGCGMESGSVSDPAPECGPSLFSGSPTRCDMESDSFCFCSTWNCESSSSGCDCSSGQDVPEISSCEGSICCLTPDDSIAWCSCGDKDCDSNEIIVPDCHWSTVEPKLAPIDEMGHAVVHECEKPTHPGTGGSGGTSTGTGGSGTGGSGTGTFCSYDEKTTSICSGQGQTTTPIEHRCEQRDKCDNDTVTNCSGGCCATVYFMNSKVVSSCPG